MEDGVNMMKCDDLNIIYEDNHIIVVEKPFDIPTQKDKTNDIDMMSIVKEYLKKKYNKKGDAFLGLVHRLDRPTSGLMVFAKTSKAASRLSEEIREGRFKKRYRAIVKGEVEESGRFEDYLQKNQKLNKSFVIEKDNPDSRGNKPKKAILEYTRIWYDEKKNRSLVDINLITGRHHQIRVQFASRNHPVLSDAKYDKKHMNQNLKLYSYYLSFKHPTKDEALEFKYIPDEYV